MIFRTGAVFVIITVYALIVPAAAQVGFHIRDAEIENTIRAYTTPLLENAGLDSDAVEVNIINHPDINAFVAGGKKIFIFTGLLQKTNTPDQLIGVLAHEIGHITGGHLARTQDSLKAATTQRIITMLLGTAAAAAGQGSASAAIISSGRHVSLRRLLKYSRNQESAADQAAFRILEATGQSAKGFVEFLKILRSQELLMTDSKDPYVRSHPLTLQRISAAKRHLSISHYTNVSTPVDRQVSHDRMKAKLMGYLQPKRALRHYDSEDSSLAAYYARAIANFRISNYDIALEQIDQLISDNPNDPYFHETRGDILFEQQRLSKSTSAYGKALTLLPDSSLFLVSLARVQLALGDANSTKKAILNLEQSIHLDAMDSTAWRLLSIAYGRTNQIGLASLANAEEFFLAERHEEAERSAKRAQKLLTAGTPPFLRAQDIIDASTRAK